MSDNQPNEFEEANKRRQASMVLELIAFMKENKKFWLIPILLALLGIGLLLILGGTAAAPFIYTLF